MRDGTAEESKLSPPRSIVLRLSLFAVLWVVCAGCTMESEIGSDVAEVQASVRVLLCQQGLSDRTVGWDKGLFELCESVEQAGFTLVRDGVHPAFGALDEDGAYEALFDTLDTSGDGVVDDDDKRSAVHLVGFSWGGINVTDLARRLAADTRIQARRRGVAAMVLFDPFQPQLSRAVVPANVMYTWVYRQTKTTSGDCSMAASLGFGFNGHRPRASSDLTFCDDYDLDSFMHGIGHCDVPLAARQAAFLNLTKRQSFAQWDAYGVGCDLQ